MPPPTFLTASVLLPKKRRRGKLSVAALNKTLQELDAKQPILQSISVGAPSNLPEREEEDNMQPMLRSGSVRAFSHLPVKQEAGYPAGPLSQRGAQALGRQLQRTGIEEAGARPEDGISAAKASGVFDVVRQQFNRDDSPHFMDEDGNLRPRDETRQPDSPSLHGRRSPQGGAGAPPRPAWSTGHAASANSSRSPLTPLPDADDTRPWYLPPITPENLDPQHFDEDDAGSPSVLKERPEVHDLVYRTAGESPPKPGLRDLLYRLNGSSEASDHHSGYFQKAADIDRPVPPLAAPVQNGEQRPEPSPTPPVANNEKPQQAIAAAPAPPPAKAAPQQPSQSGENPESDLKEYLKKSRNPFFIKNSYNAKTPLEEKLRLRQLLLSLKAPPGVNLPFFIAHLQHWLNAKTRPLAGQEKPMEYALKDFMQFPVVPEAIKKVRDYFGNEPDSHLGKKTFFDWIRAHPDAAKPGGVDVPDTYFETVAEGGKWGYPKLNNEAFYYGFGGANTTIRSSGVKGFVDKNGGVTFRGTFSPELSDTYDWNLGQGTPLKPSPKIPMEMIRKYIPKDIPVISPSGDEISVDDSFFKDLMDQGYGADFKIRAPGKPVTLEFYQPNPGAPFTTRVIPASP
ncbi:MAG: hypothetical protein JWR15_368 [Prosthecobacter sp.]|nr:hypothetical protein [Prosthecobacter sp.]